MCARADALANALDDVISAAAVVQEGDVLLPRQSHHHPLTLLRGYIQQPARGDRVEAHGVNPRCGHQRKIAQNLRFRVIFAAVRLGTKRAVRYTANVEFFIAEE